MVAKMKFVCRLRHGLASLIRRRRRPFFFLPTGTDTFPCPSFSAPHQSQIFGGTDVMITNAFASSPHFFHISLLMVWIFCLFGKSRRSGLLLSFHRQLFIFFFSQRDGSAFSPGQVNRRRRACACLEPAGPLSSSLAQSF